ncbi:MAG: proline--tRNA ligase [Nanoarchaeota archaeon]|nr:proline--tRNA ligase [Nanoarchaeota archaeon]
MDKDEQALKQTKSGDFSEWYNEVVQRAGLADYAPVAGCMVILPQGYALWEAVKSWFDTRIKKQGVKNVYFPLFIPERLLKKEAEHFTGFVPEVAFIQETGEGGEKEKYALRPSSETIITEEFAKRIRSWRDLPLKYNQWCNIVRWETKATKLFLRTREFLWQEGHTLYETQKEAEKEVWDILHLYKELMETQLAIPVVGGKKTKKETFAGAEYTTSLEALMPSGRALQMGTSHYLGTNFSKPFAVRFVDRNEKEAIPHQNSWGISTRLLGAVVMVHGDDKGMVLPPAIAPTQLVIVPIIFEQSKAAVLKAAKELETRLQKQFRVVLDDRDQYSSGWKFNQWELEGVPLRIEIGPKDLEKNQVVVVRRDTGKKAALSLKDLETHIAGLLTVIQKSLFEKAKIWQDEHTVVAKTVEDIKQAIEKLSWAKVNWCGGECETKLEPLAADIRVLPEGEHATGSCVLCGKKATTVALVGKAY